MSPVQHVLVSARRLLVRRPWIHWLLVAAVAAGVGLTVFERIEGIDRARAGWGDTLTVWVTESHTGPGDPLDVVARDVPVAVAPAGAVTSIEGLLARQRIGPGEIVTDVDIVPTAGPQSLLPAGWLAVPVIESPRSGASVGDRVQVVSGGFVVSADALVIAQLDEVTLLGAPAAEAPLIPAAADADGLTLLLKP
jgi:hypothetical protein